MELSRPTVSGSTAWGNNTVLRTGRIGRTLPWEPPCSPRRLGSVGLMMLKKSLAMSILLSDYRILDAADPTKVAEWVVSVLPIPGILLPGLQLVSSVPLQRPNTCARSYPTPHASGP